MQTKFNASESMKFNKEFLTRLRARIDTAWTKGTWGKNKEGRTVLAMAEDACQWCLEGAVQKECGTAGDSVIHEFSTFISPFLPPHRSNNNRLFDFNDDTHTKKEDVLKVIDKAIAASVD